MSSSFWQPGSERPVAEPETTHCRSGYRPSESPLFSRRAEVLYALEKHSCLILSAIGCPDKAVQLPQILVDAGWCSKGASGRSRAVAVALTRRTAAVRSARLVSADLGLPWHEVGGSRVGYSVRLDAKRSPGTEIVFFTTGSLLHALKDDPLLSSLAVVVVDDTCERSVQVDLLLSLLRLTHKYRPDLRVIISSAWLTNEDIDELMTFYGKQSSVHVHIDGRKFPVRVMYRTAPVANFVHAALESLQVLYADWRRKGCPSKADVLIFVPGADEVLEQCDVIRDWAGVYAGKDERKTAAGKRPHESELHAKPVLVFPMHSSLGTAELAEVREKVPGGYLKIVVSTNVGVESVAVDGIKTVIDCGFERLNVYCPGRHTHALVTIPVTKVSANLRAACAGATGPGVCLRLYTESDFEEQCATSRAPELLVGELTDALLFLKSVGVEKLGDFRFPVRPSLDSLASALEHLYSFRAIRMDGRLTDDLGVRMAAIPQAPSLARALLAGEARGVGRQMAAVCAMLEVSETVFIGPQTRMDKSREPFAVAEGDAITLLNVFRRYASSHKTEQWCRQHGVNSSAMRLACRIRERLLKHMRSGRVQPEALAEDAGLSLASRICRALACGLYANFAQVQPDGRTYEVLCSGLTAQIHPNSVLRGRAPSWVVAYDVVSTRCRFLRNVTVVRAEWLTSDVSGVFELRPIDPLAVHVP